MGKKSNKGKSLKDSLGGASVWDKIKDAGSKALKAFEHPAVEAMKTDKTKKKKK